MLEWDTVSTFGSTMRQTMNVDDSETLYRTQQVTASATLAKEVQTVYIKESRRVQVV